MLNIENKVRRGDISYFGGIESKYPQITSVMFVRKKNPEDI